jgi:surface polysaccharide O-acyltransferase-like enzyme
MLARLLCLFTLAEMFFALLVLTFALRKISLAVTACNARQSKPQKSAKTQYFYCSTCILLGLLAISSFRFFQAVASPKLVRFATLTRLQLTQVAAMFR